MKAIVDLTFACRMRPELPSANAIRILASRLLRAGRPLPGWLSKSATGSRWLVDLDLLPYPKKEGSE